MQIKNISRAILDEYHGMFGKQVAKLEGDIDSETLEEQKCQLNYELNCSGKYFAFKEQLKVNIHLFNYSMGFMKHLLTSLSFFLWLCSATFPPVLLLVQRAMFSMIECWEKLHSYRAIEQFSMLSECELLRN